MTTVSPTPATESGSLSRSVRSGKETPAIPETPPSGPPPLRSRGRSTPLAARGEIYVWMTGAGLALGLLMIVGLLSLVIFQGGATFWPRPVLELTLVDGNKVLGEESRSEFYRPTEDELAKSPESLRARTELNRGLARRRLLRTGNFDLYGDDYRWVSDLEVASEAQPADAWVIERSEWGRAIGRFQGVARDGAPPSALDEGSFPRLHLEARSRAARIRELEKHEVGDVNRSLEELRLKVRKAAIRFGENSQEHRLAAEWSAQEEKGLTSRYDEIESRIAGIREQDSLFRAVFHESSGRLLPEKPGDENVPMRLSQIVRAYPANRTGLAGRIRIYLARWIEYLTNEPREANTEGGVFPAIFGTFLMTVMMSVAVAPFGVITALYLREYAKQGALVSAVRIAVNNLAGVPSIVFGVFGLGFFCYGVGGGIDRMFFPERLPTPTFGTGGILWASLTLALLAVPVVIVSTEEALAAVPRSLREGSYACGASKWQTIRRVVLPQATPGIVTGLILAMARGAGEVAPLMLTGVVKLAPEMPFDRHFPWIHTERSFMHLGFHIFDVGFQSRNSEAGKPMVFTTTLLLIALVATMNLSAVWLRSRLRRRFKGAHF